MPGTSPGMTTGGRVHGVGKARFPAHRPAGGSDRATPAPLVISTGARSAERRNLPARTVRHRGGQISPLRRPFGPAPVEMTRGQSRRGSLNRTAVDLFRASTSLRRLARPGLSCDATRRGWPEQVHCCPVWMGWTRRKASAQAGFRRIGRIRTRIAARLHLPSLSPCCHPGLEPGSREVGRRRCLWPWTPAQGRGDSGGEACRRRPVPPDIVPAHRRKARAIKSKPDSSGTSPGMTEEMPRTSRSSYLYKPEKFRHRVAA